MCSDAVLDDRFEKRIAGNSSERVVPNLPVDPVAAQPAAEREALEWDSARNRGGALDPTVCTRTAGSGRGGMYRKRSGSLGL